MAKHERTADQRTDAFLRKLTDLLQTKGENDPAVATMLQEAHENPELTEIARAAVGLHRLYQEEPAPVAGFFDRTTSGTGALAMPATGAALSTPVLILLIGMLVMAGALGWVAYRIATGPQAATAPSDAKLYATATRIELSDKDRESIIQSISTSLGGSLTTKVDLTPAQLESIKAGLPKITDADLKTLGGTISENLKGTVAAKVELTNEQVDRLLTKLPSSKAVATDVVALWHQAGFLLHEPIRPAKDDWTAFQAKLDAVLRQYQMSRSIQPAEFTELLNAVHRLSGSKMKLMPHGPPE
jgi:hypothetical protein